MELLIVMTTFAGLTSMIAVPLLVLVGVPLAAWLARSWLRIRERELQLREYELVFRLREARALPAWVDERDPQSLLAWMRTDRELAALDPRHRAVMPPSSN